MSKFLFINKTILLLIPLVIFYCDYSSKKWIINNFILYEIKPIFSYLNFFYNRNYGIAFSFFSKQGSLQNVFFAIISIVIIVFLIFDISNTITNNKFQYFSYSLIIGGSLSNVFDRLNYGFVIDFIDFHIKNWHFAIFNIADVSISIGFFIKIIDDLFNNKEKYENIFS